MSLSLFLSLHLSYHLMSLMHLQNSFYGNYKNFSARTSGWNFEKKEKYKKKLFQNKIGKKNQKYYFPKQTRRVGKIVGKKRRIQLQAIKQKIWRWKLNQLGYASNKICPHFVCI